MSHDITLESLLEDLHGIELEIYETGILEENRDFSDWAALLGMRAKCIELFKVGENTN